jgi:putative oxidoreductase
MAAIQRLEPFARSLLRLVVGFTFSLHGFQKLFGLFGGMGGTGATVRFLSLLWIAGLLEAVGGLLMILGLFTRTTAFILCGEMAYAYFTVHYPRGFFPIRNGGELAVLYSFIYLYMSIVGAGPVSLDAFIRKKGNL